MLQAAGYNTAMVGKIPPGWFCRRDSTIPWYCPDRGTTITLIFWFNGERQRFEGYVTELTTQFALDWLEEGRDKDKPFLLILQPKAPHRNWKPAPKYLTLYDDKDF